MSNDDDSDKSFEPTAKKLEEARKKGEIVKSTDVTVAASYLGLCFSFMAAGSSALILAGDHLMYPLEAPDGMADLVFSKAPAPLLRGWSWSVMTTLASFFVWPAIAVLGALVLQRAILFVPSKISVKPSRLNPLQNAKNKYGRSGLFEFLKSFVKLLLFSVCLGVFIKFRLGEMAGLIFLEPAALLAKIGVLSIEFLLMVLGVATSIAVVDYMWQRQEHIRKNMMSRKDMTDEAKESEGDPHVKQHRRQRAQEIAMNQMMADVPDADVIIVNPTHYAVALKWGRGKGEAPICVAKGVDEVAKQIRQRAQEAAVPIHSDPPCARALFATIELGQEVLPEHYQPVAAAIRFADQMRKKAKP